MLLSPHVKNTLVVGALSFYLLFRDIPTGKELGM